MQSGRAQWGRAFASPVRDVPIRRRSCPGPPPAGRLSGMDRYATQFSDEQIVEAFKQVAAQGVRRENAADRGPPPTLGGFAATLPRPERERLLDLAYPPKPGRT